MEPVQIHGWNSGLSDEASERQNRQKSAPDESESIIFFNPVCLVDYAILTCKTIRQHKIQ